MFESLHCAHVLAGTGTPFISIGHNFRPIMNRKRIYLLLRISTKLETAVLFNPFISIDNQLIRLKLGK